MHYKFHILLSKKVMVKKTTSKKFYRLLFLNVYLLDYIVDNFKLC